MDPGQAGFGFGAAGFADGEPHGATGGGGGEEVQYRYRVAPVKGGGLGDVAYKGTGAFGGGVTQTKGRGTCRGECDGAGVGQLT